jgi:molybdenum cofactor cytidylyltransferase
MPLVPAVILSAGRSSRMGRSKALLPCSPVDGDTFLNRIINSLRAGGVEDVFVVGRPDDTQLIDAVESPDVPARFVPNPDHDRGQLTSIVAGVNAVDHPGVGGVLIMPVDMPLVQASTFRQVLHAFSRHPSSIVRAVYGGRHGHPVIFDHGTFDPLRQADVTVGAKAVLAGHRDRIIDLEVNDAGVLKDVDSREEYSAVFGRTLDS